MTPEFISTLLTDAGPWVLLIVSLMTGWLYPKKTVDRQDAQILRLEGQVDERDKEIRRLHDLLFRATHVAKTTVELAAEKAEE